MDYSLRSVAGEIVDFIFRSCIQLDRLFLINAHDVQLLDNKEAAQYVSLPLTYLQLLYTKCPYSGNSVTFAAALPSLRTMKLVFN
jgi:hypothetical protein